MHLALCQEDKYKYCSLMHLYTYAIKIYSKTLLRCIYYRRKPEGLFDASLYLRHKNLSKTLLRCIYLRHASLYLRQNLFKDSPAMYILQKKAKRTNINIFDASLYLRHKNLFKDSPRCIYYRRKPGGQI